MTRRSHLAAWLLSCLVALLAWPAWTGPERLAERSHQEAETTRRTFDPRLAAQLLAGAAQAQAVFGRHGVDDLLRPRSTAPGSDDRSDRRYLLAAWGPIAYQAERYLAALRLQFHGTVLRALCMAAWCVLLLPLGMAAVVDGWTQRAVKAAQFGYQNPAAFAVASHLFIASAMLPIAALLAPVAMPPLFLPMCLMAAMVPLRMAIAHMQPVFTG